MEKNTKVLLYTGITVGVVGIGYLVYRLTKKPSADNSSDGTDNTSGYTPNVNVPNTRTNGVPNSTAPKSNLQVIMESGGANLANQLIDSLFGKKDKKDAAASEMEGTLVNDNWNDEGGYYYLFPDGSQDYYSKDGTLVEQRDKNHNLV